jgi:hypothetical protein
MSGKIHSCDLSWKNVKHNEVGAIKTFWERCECFITLQMVALCDESYELSEGFLFSSTLLGLNYM